MNKDVELILALKKINILLDNFNDAAHLIEKLRKVISGLTPIDGYSENLVGAFHNKVNERLDKYKDFNFPKE